MRVDLGTLKSLAIATESVVGGVCLAFSLLIWWLRGHLPLLNDMSSVLIAMAWCFLAFGLCLFCLAAAGSGHFTILSSVLAAVLALIAAGSAIAVIVFMVIHIARMLGRSHS